MKSMAVAAEVDSHEYHMSPEDHAKTLAWGRRMGVAQIVTLTKPVSRSRGLRSEWGRCRGWP